MRETKVRAWDKVNKCYANVISISFDGEGRICEVNTDTYCHFPTEKDTVDLEWSTGLKDRDGVEIYEGDLVEYGSDYRDSFVAAVGWDDAGCFAIRDPNSSFYDDRLSEFVGGRSAVRVIGSIHDASA